MASQKMKTHKGTKKRFKVSATGKVGHKPCGSSHLNSHKSGKKIRRLRRKTYLKVGADARKLRIVLRSETKFEAPVVVTEVQDEAPASETASA
jgi:large subunit ribosomal protein L35